MKSRFFSIPGLLVDVSEVVSIAYAPTIAADNFSFPGITHSIGLRNSQSVYVNDTTARDIQEYVEEYEAEQTGAWMTLTLPDTPEKRAAAHEKIDAAYNQFRKREPSMHERAMASFSATEKTGAKGG